MPLALLLLALLLWSQPAAAAPRPPGHAFRDCPNCPEMMVIPAGDFMMGAPAGEPGRDAWDGPQRRVTIKPFAAGKFDVTRGQWAAFAAATKRPAVGGCSWASGSGPKPDPDASWAKVVFPQDDTHPVVCVTWQDTQDYARWLSARTHHRYRLLTEAEWEYAARAGTATTYPWGPAPSHEQANYGAESCCSGLAAGRDRWESTSPVGAFPPNAFGLYDMHGNVLQWVQDCLHSYDAGKADGSAYEDPAPLPPGGPYPKPLAGMSACNFRMLRGGDWGDPPRMIRSAFRNYAPPKGSTIADYKSGGAGFRVARDLD